MIVPVYFVLATVHCIITSPRASKMVSSAIFSLECSLGTFPDSLKQRLQCVRTKHLYHSLNWNIVELMWSFLNTYTYIFLKKLNIDCIPQITALLDWAMCYQLKLSRRKSRFLAKWKFIITTYSFNFFQRGFCGTWTEFRKTSSIFNLTQSNFKLLLIYTHNR